MIEGWYNKDYLVLFDDPDEVSRMTELYGFSENLPGYVAVGLNGWDDFIVRDDKQNHFTLPAAPLAAKYLSPYIFSVDPAAIQPDERFRMKIKWYVKPIMFGGDPTAKENMAWLTYEQHAQAVCWWSKFYRDTVGKNVKG